jgi:hypothetical protein
MLVIQYLIGGDAVRTSEGEFDFKSADWASRLLVFGILGILIGVPMWGTFQITQSLQSPSFLTIFLISYAIYLLINIWDLVVIDYLLVVRWHPAAIDIPDTPYFTTMRPHLLGFGRGCILGIFLCLVTTTIIWFF